MRLLVLDGNSIINRAFYGVKPLTTKDGLYTNALYGFLNIYQKLCEQVQPDHVAAAFDLAAPTFRHRKYAEYKAGRRHMPEELAQQLPLCKELLRLMGLTVVEKEGYEADDILGTLSAAAAAQGGDCFIATGDRDSLQLVGEHVTVLLAATKMGRPETTVYDPAAVREKYGLSPEQLIDLKALMGDTSDNIPGVPGVGEKTALDLMQRFHSLDEIYRDLDTLDIRDSLRQKLANGRESALLSRELGTICRTAPVDTDMQAYAMRAADTAGLAQLLTRLEFFKQLEKLGLDGQAPTPALEANLPVRVNVVGEAALDGLLDKIKAQGELPLLPVYREGAIAAFCVAADGVVASVLADTPAFDRLLELIEDPSVKKYTHDAKALHGGMLRLSRRAQNIAFDTLLAGYLLNPLSSGYALSRLCQEYGVALPELSGAPEQTPVPEEQAQLSFETLEDAPAEAPVVSADDLRLAAALPGAVKALGAEIAAQGQEKLLGEMEIPLAGVLADMERIGFLVDGPAIAEFGRVLQTRIDDVQRQITEAVGYSFNLNSPKQLGKALFEDLGLPAKKKTKSGYSTNAEVLESLRDAHPVVGMLLDYRMLSKLNSTYCEGLLKVIGPDGRIHSSFNQTETRTGRISSTEPNLQNIPVRQELGRELRRFFRAPDGWLLCDADYSQIELRVLAHMADDPTMIEAFNTDMDIHRITASQVFGVPEELVTPLMRSRAKAVNFGIVYGIGAHSLSQDIGVSYGEAKQYIDDYLRHYSAVAGFMNRMIEQAKANGYAETLFGRRRPLPELKAGNGVTRAFGERVARNMPIQGTAADIIKIAMVRVHRRLREEGMQARLILQVHDELIVEAPADETEKASLLLKEEMEAAADLKVKLSVDVHTGSTWYAAKG